MALKERNMISTNCEVMLQQSFSGVPLSLVKRMLLAKHNSGHGIKYSEEMRSFAMTLQFYSAKAYEFVRKTFDLALPHQAQIRKWYGKVSAEPGLTEQAFDAIEQRVAEANVIGKKVVFSLMLDEMAIKKHISWDGQKFRGYIDIGNGIIDDSLPEAKDALVLMAVCVNGSWKVPLAYFLVNGLDGKERANIVRLCNEKLSDTGALVVSLTCDGPSCHFSMLSELGANLDPSSMKPYFFNPSDAEAKIYVLLDACHMLKLVRNTLADKGILFDSNGGKILWQYLVSLEKLQDKEGLRLANKLKPMHIRWQQQKMKVNIAAQTLSSSVADAIEYCTNDLKLKAFEGSEATVKFIRLFDHLFDVLNSRNTFAKGFKSALRLGNKQSWNPFLDDCYQYIKGLRAADGTLIQFTRRKTAFIGFMTNIRSIQGLFNDHVEKDESPMKYLLTYKFSQDHLELFFGAVRAAGGFNNNPTSQQFTAAYKRLLMRTNVKGGQGNCIRQDMTGILNVTGDTYRVREHDITITDAALARKYDITDKNFQQLDHDYAEIPNITSISEYKQAAISYIAGYVAKMASKKLLCITCIAALGSKTRKPVHTFISFKDRGGLWKPAASVVKVCEVTELRVQKMLAFTSGKLPQGKGVLQGVTSCVLQDLDISKIFNDLDQHMFESTATDNHIFILIKTIASCYCKIRFHHLAKETTQRISGDIVRKRLNKLVLFKHQ